MPKGSWKPVSCPPQLWLFHLSRLTWLPVSLQDPCCTFAKSSQAGWQWTSCPAWLAVLQRSSEGFLEEGNHSLVTSCTFYLTSQMMPSQLMEKPPHCRPHPHLLRGHGHAESCGALKTFQQGARTDLDTCSRFPSGYWNGWGTHPRLWWCHNFPLTLPAALTKGDIWESCLQRFEGWPGPCLRRALARAKRSAWFQNEPSSFMALPCAAQAPCCGTGGRAGTVSKTSAACCQSQACCSLKCGQGLRWQARLCQHCCDSSTLLIC